MRRKRKAALLMTLAVGCGGTAALAQGGDWSYSGAKPPKLPLAIQQKGSPPQLPAAAVAERARIQDEVRRTGRTPPVPMWDPATNDVHRNPDGSVKLFDVNRAESPRPVGPPCATPRDCRP